MPEGAVLEKRLAPEEWPNAVAETDGPQLVVAGPGAGKTEFLVRRVAHLIEQTGISGAALLILTFSRRAASDLHTRIHACLGTPVGTVRASTFHSFFHRLLEAHAPSVLGWSKIPAILTGPEQISLVQKLLTEGPRDLWPKPFRNLLATRTFASEVTDFILRAKERLIDPGRLEQLAQGRADWRALPDFLRRYNQQLEKAGLIDYGGLQTNTALLLEEESVRQSLADQYQYLLVDEYQDTTVAQAEMLHRLSRVHGHITVAADPYQSIYEFRGADLNNVVRFIDQHQQEGQKPVRRWVLHTSFRTPEAILRAAEKLTTGISLPGTAGPVNPAPHPGRVDTFVFDHPSEESEWIASQVVRLHIEEQIPYHRMAVLVRTKRRLLVELSRTLERWSIPHDRPDVRLVDHPAVRTVFDLAQAAVARNATEAAEPLRHVLLGRLFQIGISEYRRLESRVAREELSWWEVIRQDVGQGQALAQLLRDPQWADQSAMQAFWHLWTHLPQFHSLAHDPQHQEYRAAWASLSQMLNRVAERSPSTTLMEYARLADSDDFEADPLFHYRADDSDHLVLTTMHQSKGLDFEVVFIADAVEGVLPDLRRHQSLLQVEQLNPRRRSRDTATRLRIQEETRLVYTAMTRARTWVVFTATKAGNDVEQQPPSRFLVRLASPDLPGPPTALGERNPVTPREAEAWLRTILSDIDRPVHRRLAAAQVLSTSRHPGMRSPHQFALVRPRGHDTGLVAPEMTFSPTLAESYAKCPRRYVLEKVLRASGPSNFYTEFGTLIHKVLEEVEHQAIERGKPSTLRDGLEQLDKRFPDYDFGTGSHPPAWKKRAITLLECYYQLLHTGQVPLQVEKRVELELPGTKWVGRIDCIHHDKGGRRLLIDYKASKTVPPKAEAASSLQLGFYWLATHNPSDLPAETEDPYITAAFWHPLALEGKTSSTQGVRNFEPGQAENVRNTLIEIAHKVRAEHWDPTPGKHCKNCAVQLVCPAWPQGREAYLQ